MSLPVTYNNILSAAEQISEYAICTPILESPQLNDKLGGRLLLKAESLQLAGSFKFRGAFNRISRLSEEEKNFGVVAFSSGNHAQGVALASKILDIPAVIVMPKDAPQLKINNTRSFGAEIIFYDRASENREKISQQLSKERNATLVPSYDDPYIIAGQGTVGLEIVSQINDIGANLDVLISPCGGGGLISGTALAFSKEFSDVEIYSAEPVGFDDTLCSLAAGKRLPIDGNSSTFCDSLMLPIPGELTFPINMEFLKGGFSIKDIDTARAMAVAFQYFKLVLEPGGAIALAAVINRPFDFKDKTVCVICSGGNVDSHVFSEAIRKDILL
jgi:threonine dehydratase